LLSDTGGIKTYKYYITGTGGTLGYDEYKFQNGRTLEVKTYSEDGVLDFTTTYTYTNNTTQASTYQNDVLQYTQTSTVTNIRGKINWTLSSMDYPSSPASSYHQTVEVVSDSATELVIQVKTFDAGNVLTGQIGYTYKPISTLLQT